MDHHPDCDGWQFTHRQETERLGDMRRLVCRQDGRTTHYVGSAVTDPELRRMAACRSEWVSCDGRCSS